MGMELVKQAVVHFDTPTVEKFSKVITITYDSEGYYEITRKSIDSIYGNSSMHCHKMTTAITIFDALLQEMLQEGGVIIVQA